MSQELGRPEDWVALRAGPFALLTEESETQTGQQILRYPAEVLDALRKCAARSEGQSKTWKVLPAGDWLTQTAIARKLGRGERPWVSNRLGAFKDLCEPRLGPKGLVYLHYPPVVARALLEESKRLADLPAQGDWLTEKGIAQNIGRSQAWVAKRIGQFKHLAEDRLDPAARIFVCYPAHVADALRRLSEEEVSWPPIGDWYTVFGLAKAIGRRWAWVDSRLGPYRHLSEPRVDDQGVCRDCYPPQVKEALEDVSQSERNAKPKPGWLSIPALASALGRSAPWVAKRLGPYLHLGEEMPNKQGRLFPYYPPSVLEALRKQDEEEMARRADLLYHWRHA